MRNLIAFAVVFVLLISCSPDDRPKFTMKVLPVVSYVLPDSLFLGQTQTFKIRYNRPSTCYLFEGFYYEKDLNQRTIGVNTSVFEENCQPLTGTPLEVELRFFTTNTGNYIFKFYKGKDAAGNNIFESVSVPVRN